MRISLTRVVIAPLVALVFLFSGCGPAQTSDVLQGKWKSVGDTGWGQAQPGAIVIFNGSEANLYSPRDTYAVETTASGDVLTVTGALGGSTSFLVTVIDDNNIELYQGEKTTPTVVLRRVS